MKNIVMFVAVAAGTGLIIAGIVALDRGERGAWLYLIGGLLALIVGAGPGRRLQNALFPPRRAP